MAYVMALAKTLQERFPQHVQEIIEFRGEITVVLDRAGIVEVAAFCRDTDGFEFNMLADLAGNDYFPDEPRFGISYVLYSLPLNHELRLKIYVPGSDPQAPSVTGVWKGANWLEREVYDMFGVHFEGHPDLRRILLPFDWTGHPLRKDYPLGYEEVQFSFNYDRVLAKKPQPKD